MTTTKYEFDAARWCDSMKKAHFARKDFVTAENFKQTRMRIEELEAELAALKDAARPIAQFWKGGGVQGVVRGTNPPLEEKYLDALAALVGEG